jgi:hypothetical protein
MGQAVKRKLDVAEVEAALRRAAQRAIHGTRAERSGRFLPAKKRRVMSAAKRPDARRRKA